MENPASPDAVTRLYDQLRDFMRDNDQAGVEQTCRELLQAGRPFSEILSQGAGTGNMVRRLQPEVPQSSPYYWERQWTVRPNFLKKASGLIPLRSDQTAGSDLPVERLNIAASNASESELHASPPREWVEQWQAQQELTPGVPEPRPQSSEAAGDPHTLVEKPDIINIANDTSPLIQRNSSSAGRFSALLMPIVGLYIGAVAVVGFGLLLFMYLGEKKPAIAPGRVPSSSEDLAEQAPQPPMTLAARPGMPTAGAITDDRGVSTNQSGEASLTPTDSLSSPAPPKASPVSADHNSEATLSPVVPPPSVPTNAALPSAGEGLPQAPDTTLTFVRIDTPSPEATARTVAAAPSTLTSTSEIVVRGIPASGAAEPRSPVKDRSLPPTRPMANAISTELKVDAISPAPIPADGTLPNAAESPFQIESETTPTVARADPGPPNDAGPTDTVVTSVPATGASISVQEAPAKSSTESQPPTVEAVALLARGDALFGIGDIASARLFYERAANAGNAKAAIRMGETFDPSFLARARLNGVRGDPVIAVHWYRRASELGSSEADILATSVEKKSVR